MNQRFTSQLPLPTCRPRRLSTPAVTSLMAAVLTLPFWGGTAVAQSPTFQKFKAEKDLKVDPKKKEKVWTAQVKAGLLVTSGNSQQVSFSGAGSVARKAGNNRIGLDASWAYARATPLAAADLNGNGLIEPREVTRTPTTAANAWGVKARYDRYFFKLNSVYATAQVGGDTVAGKDIFTGAQAGYSRAIYKDKRHELTAELGYDFIYERYDQNITMGELGSNAIHSLRFFLAYKLKINKTASGFIEGEGLFNFNRENAATADGVNSIAPFKDSRFNGKTGLVFNLWRNINFGLNFTVKYDNYPAPLPVFNALTPYSDGFVPFAQRLDTLTQAQLIINFL